MSTHWLKPCIDGEPDDAMPVHTPEEVIVARRDGGFWRAEAHTDTGATVLARKRWAQVEPPGETSLDVDEGTMKSMKSEQTDTGSVALEVATAPSPKKSKVR